MWKNKLVFSTILVCIVVTSFLLGTLFVQGQTRGDKVEKIVFTDGFEDATLKWIRWKYAKDGREVFIDTTRRSEETAFNGSYSLRVVGSNVTNDSVFLERSICLGYPVEVGIRGKWRVCDTEISEIVFWLENWSKDFEHICRIRYVWNSERWEVNTQEGWIALNLTAPVISRLSKKSGGGPVWNTFYFIMDFTSLKWTQIMFNGYRTLLNSERQYVGHKSFAAGQVTWGLQVVSRSIVPTVQFFDDLELILIEKKSP